MRYDAGRFNGLPRDHFIRALRAEGIPCGTGYHEQYLDGLLDEAIESKGFKRLFSPQRLKSYRDSLQALKNNKQICDTAVTFSQRLLLGDQRDMDDILNAILKISEHSAELAKRA